jgi:putative peptide zinc metalloprotease protein
VNRDRHSPAPLRKIIVSLTMLAVGFTGPAAGAQSSSAPSGGDAGGDTAVVVVNTKDDSTIFRLAFAVKRTMQDIVDNSNAAVAFASCEECQTVAVSFQVVLIMSDPDVVTTENLALALNYECSMCETLASAYQFVMTTGGQVRFTAEGNQALAEIRRALHELSTSELSITEIQAELDELKLTLAGILANELIAAGPAADSPTAPPTSSPSTASSPSTSPPATTSPSPSPSASPTPTPEPTAPESVVSESP